MAQIVVGPDGVENEFPDNMSDEQINAAMESFYNPGAGQLYMGAVENTFLGGEQFTSPNVRDISGNLNYQPVAPVELVDERGQPGGDIAAYRTPDGKLVQVDRETEVVLRDPNTNQLTAYLRNDAMDESGLMGRLAAAGRMILPGLVTGNMPTALGGARGAASAPQAAPNYARAGIEQTLSNTPNVATRTGATGFLERAPIVGAPLASRRDRTIQQAGEAVTRASQRFGAADDIPTAGERLQAGVRAARQPAEQFAQGVPEAARRSVLVSPTRATSFATKQDALYDRAFSRINPTAQTDIPQTRQIVGELVQGFDDPNLANVFRSQVADRLGNAIETAGGTVSFQDLRRLRTTIRRMRGGRAVNPSITDTDLDRLYGALTQDMRAGAETIGGATAANALRRADQYTRAFETRINNAFRRYLGTQRDAPISREAAYGNLMRDLSPRGNVARVRDMRRLLGPDEWDQVASTVIAEMGRPTTQTAAAAGTPNFNITTFLTNFRNMSEEGRDVLFGTRNLRAARRELNNLADVLSSVQQATGNLPPSGSSIAGTAMTASAVGEAINTGALPIATIVGSGLAAAGSAALASPTFLRAMRGVASLGRASPNQFARRAPQVIARLQEASRQNPALRRAVDETVASIEQARNQALENKRQETEATAPPQVPRRSSR